MKTLTLKLVLGLLKINRTFLMSNKKLALLLFLPGLEKLRWNIGKMKVYLVHLNAKLRVPAYKAFNSENAQSKINFISSR